MAPLWQLVIRTASRENVTDVFSPDGSWHVSRHEEVLLRGVAICVKKV